MKGRKRTPTALNDLRGNPGHRPQNVNEPQPEAGAEMPDDLSVMAKKHWGHVAEQLEAVGVLTKMDGPALALYCEAFARWSQGQKKCRTMGMVIRSANGLTVNPWLKVADKAHDQMMKILIEFGCTPASRPRVSSSKPKGKKAGVFKLIKGGQLDEGDED